MTLSVNYFFSARVKNMDYPHPSYSNFYETKKGNPIDILFLGNSTSMELNLKKIKGKNIANVSANAATPWHNYIDFKKIKNRLGPDLKVFHFIEYYQVKRSYFKHSVKAFMLSPRERFEIFDKNLGHVLFTKIYDNFYSFLRQWLIPRHLSLNSISPKISKKVSEKIDLSKFDISEGKNSLNDRWSQIDIQSILKIKSEVENFGGDYYVVFPPKHSLVLDEHTKGTNGLKKFLDGVTILNYLGLIDPKKENNQFFDLNHLNQVGLELLQEKLNGIIVENTSP